MDSSTVVGITLGFIAAMQIYFAFELWKIRKLNEDRNKILNDWLSQYHNYEGKK